MSDGGQGSRFAKGGKKVWIIVGVVVAVCVGLQVGTWAGWINWENIWSTALGFVVLAVLVGLYFLPTIIAGRRKHHNLGAIIAVNLIFGLSIIGWFIALIWSLTDPSPTVRIQQQPMQMVGYGQPQPPVQYQVGDVVNGHRFNGQTWEPLG